jgi:hypothetical protein
MLDLDPKDAESLNEHMHGRFLRSRRMKTRQPEKHIIFIFGCLRQRGTRIPVVAGTWVVRLS